MNNKKNTAFDCYPVDNHIKHKKGSLVNDAKSIKKEIDYLNMRLEQMRYTGDCAYENKMSEYFLKTISVYEKQLEALRNAGF